MASKVFCFTTNLAGINPETTLAKTNTPNLNKESKKGANKIPSANGKLIGFFKK